MDNNYLSRLKSLFSESVSNQDYLEELKVSDNVQELLENRYFVNLFNGKENTYKQLCKRVSRVVAATELYHYSQKTDKSFDYIINHDESASELLDYIRRVEYSIYTDMLNGNFLFNSPCLFSAGTGFSATENGHLLYDDEITLDDYRKIYNNINNKNQMLFACFVIGIEDSIEGIFESVKKCAIISKSGGGVGLNFSPLREKNAKIRGNEGLASGVVSFAGDFNAMGDSIRQGGKRRVALMGMLNSNHPDIEEFINCKTEEGKLTNFNISVAIDDKFMGAIQTDSDYDLISSVDGHVVKTVKARELWNNICESAWKRGDPGIFFVDLANRDSLLKFDEDYQIVATNPSLVAGTKVLTNNGIFNIEELENQKFIVPSLINAASSAKCFMSGENKHVNKITFKNKFTATATDEHKWPVLRNNEIVKVKTTELQCGDYIPKTPFRKTLGFGTLGDRNDGFLIGWLYGSGYIVDGGETDIYCFDFVEDDYNYGICQKIIDKISTITDEAPKLFINQKKKLVCFDINVIDTNFHEYMQSFGIDKKFGKLPTTIWRLTSDEFRLGFIDGLFSANSRIYCGKIQKIIISSKYDEFINELQILLGFYGIIGSIQIFDKKTYRVDLCLNMNNSQRFRKLVGNLTNNVQNESLQKISDLIDIDKYDDYIQVSSIEDAGIADKVWDLTVYDESHSFYLGSVVTGNCAEECLPNYTSCNLGSINLANFVLNNKFDDSEFTKMVKRGLYYLDLVIDTSAYPLPEIEERTKDIRPVGLGMMGLADLFIKMNIRYGSNESNELAEDIAQLMAGQSLYESVMLGEIKGSFPAWSKLPQQNLLNIFETEYMLNTPNYENMDNTYFEKIIKWQITSEMPISLIKAFYSLSLQNEEQFKETFKKFCGGYLRNSRRLTGPPTGCQVKDTMTVTNEGILRFDELADINSDNQWTDLNNISVAQESTNTTATKFYINGHKPTKKILTRDGLTLECTYNHKYRVLDSENNYVWKQADELNIGDKLVYRVGGYNKETNPKLDLEYKQYRSPKTVTFPEYMNEDLAFFIGVFTGNGSIDDDGKTIRIAVNMEKTEVNQRIIDVIKRLFDIDIKRISPTKGSKGGTIYLYSVEVTDKLIRLGLLKENSHLAKVPKLIRQSSISCINAFIDGLFVTDGYKDRHMRKITTVSHQLATELLIVLRAIGINGKIQIRNDKHHNATYYAVVFDIYGSNTFKNDKYVQDRFKRNHDDLLPIADNLYTTEVVEVTDSENDTFDIEVPENNTYIANSYVSHNTISMILNTSSSLEPNFAFEWKRNITGSNGEVTTRIFKHKYADIENKELLVTANELSPEEHINIVKAFATYCDSSVSKTCNLSNSATVEDVKKVYENCYNNDIKGITIYRDMSREGQTLQKIDNTEKSNNKTEEKSQIVEKFIERPKVINGYTQKGETNYGNLYATLNVVDGKPYELFVNIGKSGSLAKSLSEALSRTISISLQNGINIDEIIKTLNGIADSETPWVFEDYKGNEEWCKSIPDMIAKMMKSLSEYVKEIGAVEQKLSIEDKKDDNNIDMNSIIEHDKTSTDKKKILCPECLKNGNSIFLVQMAGCPTCPNCGWSACA